MPYGDVLELREGQTPGSISTFNKGRPTTGAAGYILDSTGNVLGLSTPIGGTQIVGARLNAVAAAGDSLVVGAVQGGSPYNQAINRNAQQWANAGNFGVAGTRTDQILAQIATAAAAGASKLLINGGVNDIVQSVPEATLRINLIANWNRARALGVEPIDMGLPPTNTAGNVPRYVANEVWRKLYCYKNNIRHADIWPLLATGAGAYTAGLNTDAIHYNSVGAIAAEPAITSRLSNLANSPPLLAMTDTAADAVTYMNNAVSFTDSNADGLANNWNSLGAGGSYSITAADVGDFGLWQRCTITAGSSVGVSATAVTMASLGWSIGDKIATGFKIRWVDSSQALTVSAYHSGITVGNQPLFAETGNATGNSITIYHETTITAGTVIGFNFFASGTGWFEFNRPIVVNLTKLGLA